MSVKKACNDSESVRSIYCAEQKDEKIWNDFRQGDKEAFSALYRRFFKLLIQSGLKITSDLDLIKDCVHDLFVNIWNSRTSLSTPDSVNSYLVISLRREILRQLKKSRLVQADIEKIEIEEKSHSAEESLIVSQEIEEQENRMSAALKCLTKRQKEAIYLKFYANLSYIEIGKKMAIGSDSIYNLISKAIHNMISINKLPR